MPEMIDVFGKYQGAIDWHQVWAAGVRMVATKLTNGPKVASPTGDSYVDGARAVGMLIGGYHYALAGDPGVQARVFAGELLRLVALDLAPALDFEDPSLPTDTPGRRAFIVSFFTELKAAVPRLTKALLYSSGTELESIGSITVPGLVILPWDAEYGPNDGSPHPIVHYTGTAAVHQYTSVGRLPGITTAVDEDQVLVDITEVPMTDPVDVNIENFIALGGPATRVSTMAEFVAAGGDPTSVFGRTLDVQLALTAKLPAIMAVLDGLAKQVGDLSAAVAALKPVAPPIITPVAGTYPVTGNIVLGRPAPPATS
jgi:GH25 family lysozyme M1 (1,4-beta-N-acetylmuramidase)